MARSHWSWSLHLAALVVLAFPTSAVPVRLVIEPCSELPPGDVSIAAWTDLGSEAAEPLVVEASGPLGESLELDLSPDHRWRLSAESNAFWSAAGWPVDPAKETLVRLPAFPRAVLAGRLRVPRGERPPTEVVARLSPARGAAGDEVESRDGGSRRCSLEQAVVTCPVDDGRFACTVPSGEWNVRLKAERWAGRHLWRVRLDPQGTWDAGDLELRHGSTLLGEVTTIDGPADPRITRIRLEPVSSREPGRGVDPSIRRELAATERLNAQGYFVFEDLVPGAYTVAAHQPGYAPSVPLHVEVVENRETALRDPIVLRPPLRLSARIIPAVDPHGGRWRLELARWMPSGEQLEVAASGDADEEGTWEVEGLPPGTYRLEVVDRSGDPLAVEEPILLEEGDGLELAIAVDLVEVNTRVLLGDEALPHAEVWFGGRFGRTRVHAVTDEEGEVVAFLPRTGEWRVDVRSEVPRVVDDGRSVEVPEDGGELEIRLPDTRLRGRVLAEGTGQPVVGSAVRLVRADVRTGASGVLTDAEGRFDLAGLDTGSYLVQAEKDSARSEMVTVDLREEVVPPELTLTLRRRITLEGHVIAQHGGVPGARVEVVPLSASGELVEISVPSAVTDASGRFATDLPAQTQEVLVTVLAPGFALTLARGGVEGMRIAVAPSAGRLRLARTNGDDGATGAAIELVMIDGQPVDVPTLLSWAAMHGDGEGGDLVVPALPAGAYRYCLVRFEEALLVFAGRAVPTRCTEGILTPGDELRLNAPW